MKKEIANTAYMSIVCSETETAIGGSQEWCEDRWQKMSGCGPVAASNIVWYMARSRPELAKLCDVGEGRMPDFLNLMCEMFKNITPGAGGVNKASIFTEGITRYGESRGVTFSAHALEIPALCKKRPSEAAAREFIAEALDADVPVAFLNLSNGTLENLEGWHWVTIISLSENLTACISDQGKAFDIDFAEWLRTTKLGGALVYVTV